MKKLLLLALTFVSLFAVSVPATTFAWNPFEGVDCSQANASATCTDAHKNGNPLTGPDGLLIKVTNIIAVLSGIAAVIMIIVSGLKYITSNGDSNSISSAKTTLMYSLIGIVVIILAQTIVTFVLSKL